MRKRCDFANLITALQYELRIRGVSLQYTAEAMGVSAQHLYKIFAGERRPSKKMLDKWAALYDLDITSEFILSTRLPKKITLER